MTAETTKIQANKYRLPEHHETHRMTILSHAIIDKEDQASAFVYELKGPGTAGNRYRFYDFDDMLDKFSIGDTIMIDCDSDGFVIQVYKCGKGSPRALLTKTAMHSSVEVVGE